MPQMAPLNWLSLFFLFVWVLLLFNSINYFSINYYPMTYSTKKSLTQINWKW
uniref:ATP synthase complex subunit 8 n=1 Tax=Polyphylla laticollis mandshurica TaxID=1415276 RepID=A0A0K0K8L2_9SCAR|nr:ATP synthase F0 subunit 8 [Polyphylla laticollis mandshurica]